MGSANKKAKKAGEDANKLITQHAMDTGLKPASSDPDDQAQLKEVPKDDPEASGDPEKNLDQPSSSDAGAEPAKTDDDWEARFKGAQAAYNRDVPKMRRELETAYKNVDGLQKQIDELKAAINKPAESTVEEQIDVEFTAEEIEQYGPGQIGMMQRIAEGSKGDLVKQVVALQEMVSELKNGQQRIVEHTAVSDEEKFFRALDKAVPNWATINNAQKFHDFLSDMVPYSDKRKRDILDEAREALDSRVVIQLFTDYIGVAPNSSSHSDEPELKPEFDTPEDLINPDNSGGGAPPVAEEKYYTNAEVTQFYKDKSAGKYKGKEEEARSIENDIFAAGQTGRILTDRQADAAYKFGKDD